MAFAPVRNKYVLCYAWSFSFYLLFQHSLAQPYHYINLIGISKKEKMRGYQLKRKFPTSMSFHKKSHRTSDITNFKRSMSRYITANRMLVKREDESSYRENKSHAKHVCSVFYFFFFFNHRLDKAFVAPI